MTRAAAWLAALLLAGPAAGQERPSEEDLFGSPEQAPPAEPAPEAGEPARRGAAPEPPAPRAIAETLSLGGLLYLRAFTAGREGEGADDWALASPNLLDVWLDARPNDRVRGFTQVRTLYDPTMDPDAPEPVVVGSTIAVPESNPLVALDQLWVNFDVARTVFVTAGKQHVKWGVGRFWSPGDFLHPVRRDPLDPFDVRAGTTMVRAHLPWEARAWNLYAVALLEDVAGGPPPRTLGDVGIGGRAEVVLGPAEMGASALAQRGHHPRFALDLSAGIWDLDVHAEVVLRTGTDHARWREVDPGLPPDQRFQPFTPEGPTPAVVAGGEWSWKYGDEDVLTVGAEYFFNDEGYEDARLYPVLLYAQADPEFFLGEGAQAEPWFTPFYLGRHYAGAFLLLPAPGSWNDTTFTLSALANLSDRSTIVRLDHSVVVNTHLRIETYAAVHAGRKGGEFRFAVTPESLAELGFPPVVDLPASVVELGVALRVDL
jgi:hypothetical protein